MNSVVVAPSPSQPQAIMVEPLSEADGGGWLATVPALPGCMSDGDTPEEALANAETAIAEWHAAKLTAIRLPAEFG